MANSVKTVKMVVTGPFASGKTEFIKSISEIDVVQTDTQISKNTYEATIKSETTVAMDFGRNPGRRDARLRGDGGQHQA